MDRLWDLYALATSKQLLDFGEFDLLLQIRKTLTVLTRSWNLRVMAIFSTFTSILVALVPETHGPTLFKRKALLSREEEEKLGIAKVELGERIRKVLGVYKQALKRPVLFFFTGELLVAQSWRK